MELWDNIFAGRWLALEHRRGSIPTPLMAVLVGWLAVIFGIFGFSAPRNWSMCVVFLLCALSATTAVFVVIDLDTPFQGMVNVSKTPMLDALKFGAPWVYALFNKERELAPGMPAVSDPGFRLVAACVQEGLRVTCLPGPSAVTTALAVSGLPSDRFCFEGFAPRRGGPRRRWLAGLASEARTCVFFESPHRLAATLTDAADVLGADRAAAVCRELTKPYEEVRRGGLAALAQWAADGVRGEVTVVLSGAPAADPPDVADLVDEVTERVSSGERLKEAVAAVATAHGVAKRDLYQAAVDSS